MRALACLLMCVALIILPGCGALPPETEPPTPMQVIMDSRRFLQISIPSGWHHKDETSILGGPGLVASPDLSPRQRVSKLFFGVSERLARDQGIADGREAVALDGLVTFARRLNYTRFGCSFAGSSPYVGHFFLGFTRRWTGCFDGETTIVELFAFPRLTSPGLPSHRDYMVYVMFTAATAVDVTVADWLFTPPGGARDHFEVPGGR